MRPARFSATVMVLAAIGVGGALLIFNDDSGGDPGGLQARAIEAQQVHDADLPLVYAALNRQYFGGQLPNYVSVSWADLVANKDCASCAGLTDWDTGFPRIRLDPKSVRTENFLREAMEHEMCHVATADAATTARQDLHGPLFQECMQRYQTPGAISAADRLPAR